MNVYLPEKKISPQTSNQTCELTDIRLEEFPIFLFLILCVTLLGLYISSVLSGCLPGTHGKATSESSGAFLKTSDDDE